MKAFENWVLHSLSSQQIGCLIWFDVRFTDKLLLSAVFSLFQSISWKLPKTIEYIRDSIRPNLGECGKIIINGSLLSTFNILIRKQTEKSFNIYRVCYRFWLKIVKSIKMKINLLGLFWPDLQWAVFMENLGQKQNLAWALNLSSKSSETCICLMQLLDLLLQIKICFYFLVIFSWNTSWRN